MTINNSKNVIRHRIRQLFVTIGFIAVFTVLFTTLWIKTPILGFSRKEIGFGLLILYICYLLLHIFRNLNYILYNDEGPKIILRYYSIKIFAKDHHSVEIHKKDFHHYEIRRHFLGLRPELTLYMKMKKGMGRYPGISLSSLNRKQRKDLIRSLDRYVKTV